MLIQNVIFLMNASFKCFLDLFPSFCIGIHNNNFYFYDIHHLEIFSSSLSTTSVENKEMLTLE